MRTDLSCDLEEANTMLFVFGNDFLPGFSRKGKTTYWKKTWKNTDHISIFPLLDSTCRIELKLM